MIETLLSITALAIVLLVYSKGSRSPSSIALHRFESIPDTHENYVHSTRHLHLVGYNKYSKHGLAYKVRTSAGGERIILPPKYLEEVKSMPQSIASLPEEMSHLLLMSLTGVPQRTDAGTKVIRVDVTRHLADLIPAMDEECRHAFERFLPQTDTWTPVTIYPALAKVVAQVSGRVMVGQEMCRDDNWLSLSISFSTYAFGAARFLRAQNKWPWSMLWHSCVSEPVRRLRSERGLAAAMLLPACHARLEQMGSAPDSNMHQDGMQWLIESHINKGESLHEVVKSQLRLTMAAIHNTTMAVTNDLFDLLAHPEYFHTLRNEVAEVLKHDTGWTKHALTKLRKVDSFMKESARMNPTTMLTVKRRVLQDTHLHDGLVIPRGSHIAFASDGMNQDAEIYDKPDAFDGLRFYNLRHASNGDLPDDTTMQYVTATSTYLNWGGGRSACPGRYMASYEIKLMLAYMLQHYDFQWPDGESRPSSIVNDWNILPRREQEVLIRRRQVPAA